VKSEWAARIHKCTIYKTARTVLVIINMNPLCLEGLTINLVEFRLVTLIGIRPIFEMAGIGKRLLLQSQRIVIGITYCFSL
jgi:hypothetical protein